MLSPTVFYEKHTNFDRHHRKLKNSLNVFIRTFPMSNILPHDMLRKVASLQIKFNRQYMVHTLRRNIF